MFAASTPDCITADKNSIHAPDFGHTLAGSTVGKAVCFVFFFFFSFSFLLLAQKGSWKIWRTFVLPAAAGVGADVHGGVSCKTNTVYRHNARRRRQMFLKEKIAWNFIQRKKKRKRGDNHLKQAFVFLSFTKYILFSSLKPSVRHSGVLYIPPHSALWNLLRSAPKTQKKRRTSKVRRSSRGAEGKKSNTFSSDIPAVFKCSDATLPVAAGSLR